MNDLNVTAQLAGLTGVGSSAWLGEIDFSLIKLWVLGGCLVCELVVLVGLIRFYVEQCRQSREDYGEDDNPNSKPSDARVNALMQHGQTGIKAGKLGDDAGLGRRISFFGCFNLCKKFFGFSAKLFRRFHHSPNDKAERPEF